MFSRILCLAVLLSLTTLCFGQSTFGLQIGQINQARQGSALCDSIAVTGLTGMQPLFIGVFYNADLSERLALRSELNYFGNSLGALVFNIDDDCIFCPVIKAGSSFYATFELPLIINYTIPLTRSLSLGALGGFAFHFNIPRHNNRISFGSRHQGVADVMNALHDTPQTVVTNYIYGLRVDIWRLTLMARYQHNIGSTVTNDIRVWGNTYPFKTSASMVHFSIGYNVRGVKLGKE